MDSLLPAWARGPDAFAFSLELISLREGHDRFAMRESYPIAQRLVPLGER
jgi:hypothetical protein